MAKNYKEEKETLDKATELASAMEAALPEQTETSALIVAHAMCLASIFRRTENVGVTRREIEEYTHQFARNVMRFYDFMKGNAADADNQGNKSDKYKTIE